MAKGMYSAIGGSTRKITKNYAVVGGVTKKITKMYAVVNGVTRLIWDNDDGKEPIGVVFVASTSSVSQPKHVSFSSNINTNVANTYTYISGNGKTMVCFGGTSFEGTDLTNPNISATVYMYDDNSDKFVEKYSQSLQVPYEIRQGSSTYSPDVFNIDVEVSYDGSEMLMAIGASNLYYDSSTGGGGYKDVYCGSGNYGIYNISDTAITLGARGTGLNDNMCPTSMADGSYQFDAVSATILGYCDSYNFSIQFTQSGYSTSYFTYKNIGGTVSSSNSTDSSIFFTTDGKYNVRGKYVYIGNTRFNTFTGTGRKFYDEENEILVEVNTPTSTIQFYQLSDSAVTSLGTYSISSTCLGGLTKDFSYMISGVLGESGNSSQTICLYKLSKNSSNVFTGVELKNNTGLTTSRVSSSLFNTSNYGIIYKE